MYRIGVDLGGTNIAVGLVDEEKKLVKKKSVPTGAERPAEQIVDDIAAVCRALCTEAGVPLSEIVSVGIATPGIANHDTGVVEYANNLPFRKLPLADMLRERLGVERVKIENDANAAAWGEAVAGAAQGTRNSIMITLGTGVGGGIIIDNKVYSGFNYAGGELGHIVIRVDGAPCSCGRHGCWEAYSSATALIRQARQAAAEHPESLLAGAEEITGKTVFDAADRGDETANAVVDRFCDYLGAGVTNIVNALAPEVILIGGGISRQGERLLAPVRRYVEKNCFGGKDGAIPIIAAARLGNDAGIIGAAAL